MSKDRLRSYPKAYMYIFQHHKQFIYCMYLAQSIVDNIYVLPPCLPVCILIFDLMMQINLMSRRTVCVVGATERHDI